MSQYLAVSSLVSFAREGKLGFSQTRLQESSDLLWMTDYVDPLSYEQALAVVREVGNGWRLPTMQELYRLVDHTRMSPAIGEAFACPSRGGVFWTSTSTCYSALDQWAVDFEYGYAVIKGRIEKAHIRLVRDRVLTLSQDCVI
jgi:hypothetical protein